MPDSQTNIEKDVPSTSCAFNENTPCTSAQAVARATGETATKEESVAPVKKPRKKPVSRSTRACLLFPVGRIERALRQGRYTKRIAAGVPIYIAAVMQYMAAEVLGLAGNAACQLNKTRIMPHHLQLAIRSDRELKRLFAGLPSVDELSSSEGNFHNY